MDTGHEAAAAILVQTIFLKDGHLQGILGERASKGAALMLTRSIAVDYAAAGIRANAVCPGMVYTPMTSWRLDQPLLRAEVESRIPAGRVASAAEIADAVAVLASGRLAYMTGHPLVIDGGMSAW